MIQFDWLFGVTILWVYVCEAGLWSPPTLWREPLLSAMLMGDVPFATGCVLNHFPYNSYMGMFYSLLRAIT